jgi:hypothetical protein
MGVPTRSTWAAPASARPAPVLGASATALAFGSINVGASSGTQTINISNTGAGTLTLSTLTPGGANPGDFARSGTCANGTALTAAQSCAIIYQFTPAAAGARAASLAVASNGGNATITLGGSGVTVVPVLSVSATTLNFGSVSVGASSATQTISVTNTGGGTLTLATLAPGGTDAADFTRSGTCANGTALTAAQSCTVVYQFTPAACWPAVGEPRNREQRRQPDDHAERDRRGCHGDPDRDTRRPRFRYAEHRRREHAAYGDRRQCRCRQPDVGLHWIRGRQPR